MNIRKIVLLVVMLCSLSFVFPLLEKTVQADPVREYGVDLAFSRRVVSSDSTDSNYNTYAVDANQSTRYASVQNDEAFFYVDLGSTEKVGKVVIDWEAAYASEYSILLSLDGLTWTEAARVTDNIATIDTIEFSAFLEARYVKFQGISRGTGYGYSFYSFEVYGPKDLAAGSDVLTVSSNENETVLNKANIVDNVASTRWASAVEDNQYIIIDLLEMKSFDYIKIRWEVSFARIFGVYITDSVNVAPEREDASWEEVAYSETGLGEVDSFLLNENVQSRYIKIELIQRQTSESTKKTGRLPFESTFSIYSFELFDWESISSVPLTHVLEFSTTAPAWAAMADITLNPTGLLLAPIGYPIEADGVVTNMSSIADGDIPGFESYGTYNPAVVYDEERGMFHMIYRAELPDNFRYYFMSDTHGKYELGHMSTLAYAYSYDGVNWVRGDANPIAWPTTGDESGGGLEDPRMFKIVNDPNRGGRTTYYITYTMYDNSVTREGIIYTYDFVTFYKQGRLAPNYSGAIKSGTYVTDPEGNAVMINDPRPGKTGKVYIIYMKDGGYTRIGFTKDVLTLAAEDIIDIDSSNLGGNDIEDITKGNESCMALTNIYGDDDEAIYLMYGGGRLSDSSLQYEQANATGWFYALGVLKTTKSNPFELTNYAYDLSEPTMYPTDTNKIDYGLFNKCMFADSMIRYNNTWYFYYGAGDMYVALATSRADFTSEAATYSVNGSVITAQTHALNKSYGQLKTAREVDFVMQIFDFSGALLDEVDMPYTIEHFTQSTLGIYSKGQSITATMDLSQVAGLPSEYYITSFVRDANTLEVLNHLSTYTVVSASITRTAR